jgi:hypothetical protein
MSIKHKKRSLTSVAIGAMKIKAMMRYNSIPIIRKKIANNKCWQECGEIIIPIHCWGDIKWHSYYGEHSGCPLIG